MLRDSSVRNVVVLALCQALSQSGAVMVFAVVGLAGQILAPTPNLATLPLGIQFVALMLATVPASLIMGRLGRRAGFTIGQCIGFLGAVLSVLALWYGWFWLLVAAAIPIGAHNAFFQYLRFAAADTATPAFRPKAVSYVMAGGVIAAFLGPELARQTKDVWPLFPFAGAYAALGVGCLLNIAALRGVAIPRPEAVKRGESGRPLMQIAKQPAFVVAVLAAMIGYGAMNLVMVSTPLAMVGCGFTFGQSTEVLRWHVLGMFVPSFFTGHLIRRFGVLRVIAFGALLVLACMGINLQGISYLDFSLSLTLLGIGWNFMFIGGTALLTETHAPEERGKAQALNDFLVFSTTAVTSFASGAVQSSWGWQAVNASVGVPVLLVFLSTVWLSRKRRVART